MKLIKQRVAANAKNMRMALQLFEIAFDDLFDDLKNVPEFRDHPSSQQAMRSVIVELVSDIIKVAYQIEKGMK